MQGSMGIRYLKDLFVGVLIGVISNVPGASGGTVAVTFGIYERLVTDIANIKNKLLNDLNFVITIFIGLIIGMILCAKCLKLFIENFEVPMMLFFAVLIITQIPDIKKMSNDEGPVTRSDVIAFIVGLMIMVVLSRINCSDLHNVDTDFEFLLMFLVGIVYAISKLVPGVSGSTILLALGLFTTFNNALADMNIIKLFPILLGLAVGVLVFAKIIEYFLKTNKKFVYDIILGLTVGSVVTIAIDALLKIRTSDMIVHSITGVILGVIFGMLLVKMAHCYHRSHNNTSRC